MATGDVVQINTGVSAGGGIAFMASPVTPGNLLVWVVVSRDNDNPLSGATLGAWTATPAGVFHTPDNNVPFAGDGGAVVTRLATVSDGSSVSVSPPVTGITSIIGGVLLEVEGPVVVADSANGSGSTATQTAPSLTPTAGSPAAILGVFVVDQSDFAVANYSPGTGWTEQFEGHNNPHPNFTVVSKTVTSASGSYAPVAECDGAFNWAAQTVLLQGEAPPTPPPDPGIQITIGAAEISDASEKTIRVEMDGTGQGMFKISRYSAQATATNLAQGNLAKVIYPAISADPIFAFFLDSGDFDLVSRDEEGGELLSFAGQGALSYLERAIMWSESFLTTDLSVVLGPGSRWIYTKSGANLVSRVSTSFASATVYTAGAIETLDYLPGGTTYLDRTYVPLTSGPHSGKYVSTKYLATPYIEDRTWRLFASSTGSKPGQILRRIIAEAQHASRPQAPLSGMTVDFDYTNDSDGNAWASSDATAEFTAQMGESLLEVVLRLVDTGAVDVVMDSDLVLHAYNSYGTDRTSLTFAAGKVRFERGINIADLLRRSVGLKLPATHALIDGDDQITTTAALPDAGTRPTVETYIALEGTDTTVLSDTGEALLIDAVGQLESVAFPIDVADDELNGKYLPGPAGTNGHFWVGDTVTLDTGTTTLDYTDDDARVMALTIKEDEAANIDCIPELSAVMGGKVRQDVTITRRGFTGGRSIVKVITDSADLAPEGEPISGDDIDMALDDLSDVEAPSPTDGQVLTWDDYLQAWVPGTGGGVSLLDDLTDVSVPTPTDGQVLKWDDYLGLWIAGAAGSGGTVDIEDEGSAEGAADTIDFTGAGVSVTFSAGQATVDIPGGSGSDLVQVASGAGSIRIPGLAGSADIPAGGGSDDEFDTTDTTDPLTGWTTLSAPTAFDTNSTTKSNLYMKANPAALGLYGIYKACPSIPFTMTVKFSGYYVNGANARTQIAVMEASPGKILSYGWPGNGSRPGDLIVDLWTNRTSYASTPVALNSGWLGVDYLRFVVTSSTAIQAQFSPHGLGWYNLGGSMNPGFTVGAVGFVLEAHTSGNPAEMWIDWVRFT